VQLHRRRKNSLGREAGDLSPVLSPLNECGLYMLRKTQSVNLFQGFVKGHDFSQANKANQINVGF
jgi:hypothetical protein